jgi:hypothetical protein
VDCYLGRCRDWSVFGCHLLAPPPPSFPLVLARVVKSSGHVQNCWPGFGSGKVDAEREREREKGPERERGGERERERERESERERGRERDDLIV